MNNDNYVIRHGAGSSSFLSAAGAESAAAKSRAMRAGFVSLLTSICLEQAVQDVVLCYVRAVLLRNSLLAEKVKR